DLSIDSQPLGTRCLAGNTAFVWIELNRIQRQFNEFVAAEGPVIKSKITCNPKTPRCSRIKARYESEHDPLGQVGAIRRIPETTLIGALQCIQKNKTVRWLHRRI